MHTINLLSHYTDTDYLPLSAMSPSLPILLLKVPYFSSYPLFDVLLVLNPLEYLAIAISQQLAFQ